MKDSKLVLEVGSGTGQHAVHFAQNLPHLLWQTSDQSQYLAGVNAQIANAKENNLKLANVLSPIQLDVTQASWLPKDLSGQQYDAVYSANTLHIMAWPQVKAFFYGLDQVVSSDTYLIIYGPFKYHGQYTSASNQHFDQDLRGRSVGSAIRDFEEVNNLAKQAGLSFIEDVTMPANNQCLIWQNKKMV